MNGLRKNRSGCWNEGNKKMKGIRKGWLVAGGILALLLLLQLFRPGFNLGEREGPMDMLVQLGASEEISELFRVSCYDCHSDHTRYPWYGKLVPVAWFLDRHVKEGKDAVNFSGFGEEGKAGQIAILTEVCEVLEAGVMPLQSYLILHGEAALEEDEKALLCDWADSQSQLILKAAK